MDIVSRQPKNPLLFGLVDRVWCAPARVDEARATERMLPTCRAQVILSPVPSRCVFVGPKSESELVNRRLDRTMVGLSLAAGATRAVVAVDGHAAVDQTLPLDCLIEIGSLGMRLLDLAPGEALDLVETEFAARVRVDHSSALVLNVAGAIRAGVPAGKAASSMGLDRRTFVPQFRRLVGVAPKHYARIVRFSRAIEAIRRIDAAPLAAIATQLGFADQSHLTREVRHFSGTRPTQIHRDASTTPNHLDHDRIFKT